MSRNAEALAAIIRARTGGAPVRLGLILGSGLGHLADSVAGTSVPYDDLPGFPHAGVSGHSPKLTIGDLEGVRVAVFGGRAHYYENGRADAMRLPLEVLRALGATSLILTNAAGSMVPANPPGSLMMLNDHINFSGLNPLIGEASDARFVPMKDAHDPEMRAALKAAAQAEGVDLDRGRLCLVFRPLVRNPGRDPGDPHPWRRCRRHVDGARGYPCAVPGPAGGGGVGHHQHGRRAER